MGEGGRSPGTEVTFTLAGDHSSDGKGTLTLRIEFLLHKEMYIPLGHKPPPAPAHLPLCALHNLISLSCASCIIQFFR